MEFIEEDIRDALFAIRMSTWWRSRSCGIRYGRSHRIRADARLKMR